MPPIMFASSQSMKSGQSLRPVANECRRRMPVVESTQYISSTELETAEDGAARLAPEPVPCVVASAPLPVTVVEVPSKPPKKAGLPTPTVRMRCPPAALVPIWLPAMMV